MALPAMKLPARWKPNRFREGSIPSLVQPVIRAYALGYASSTAPRLLTLILTYLGRRKKNNDTRYAQAYTFFHSLVRILKGGLEVQRFPTFCAVLVGGMFTSRYYIISLEVMLAEATLPPAPILNIFHYTTGMLIRWEGSTILQASYEAVFSI